jgi:hypothetical protein
MPLARRSVGKLPDTSPDKDFVVSRPVSSILNLTLLLLCPLLLAACPQQIELNPDQEAVHKAMMEWADFVMKKDTAGMWDRLSPDAQDWFRRELEGTSPPGVRATVKMNKAALEPGARTSEEDRQRIITLLATLPPEPEKMTPKDYYAWRVTPQLTPEGSERTHRLFSKSNIKAIEIEGDRATVVLKSGDPDRYSWVRHGGVWKNDVKPSILRALEDARKRETKSK